MIEVILTTRIEKLGKIGDIVKVRPGYARNFLLPQSKAIRSTKENRVVFEEKRAEIEAQDQEKSGIASNIAEKLAGKEIILIRAASESGQLYGSVTARDISNEITRQLGQEVKRTQIVLEVPIKTLGIFPQRVQLHGDVNAVIDLNVAKTEDEAKTQRTALIDAANKEKARAAKQAEKWAKDKEVAKADVKAKEAETEAEVPVDGDVPVDAPIEAVSESTADTAIIAENDAKET